MLPAGLFTLTNVNSLLLLKALLLNLLSFYCHLYFATECYSFARLWNHFIGGSFSLSLHVNRILCEDVLHQTHWLQWPHKKGVKISVLVPMQRVTEGLYSISISTTVPWEILSQPVSRGCTSGSNLQPPTCGALFGHRYSLQQSGNHWALSSCSTSKVSMNKMLGLSEQGQTQNEVQHLL